MYDVSIMMFESQTSFKEIQIQIHYQINDYWFQHYIFSIVGFQEELILVHLTPIQSFLYLLTSRLFWKHQWKKQYQNKIFYLSSDSCPWNMQRLLIIKNKNIKFNFLIILFLFNLMQLQLKTENYKGDEQAVEVLQTRNYRGS